MVSRNHGITFVVVSLFCLGLSGCGGAEQDSSPAKESVSEPTTAKPAEPPFQLEEGFVFLANQEDMSEFEVPIGDAATWSVSGHTIKCGGRPRGYLATKKSYRNFTFRLDFRYKRPKNLKDDAKFKGNTGYLIYIGERKEPWPACIEVQGKHVQVGRIVANGGVEALEATDDEEARIASRKPAGEWNSIEIRSHEGALVSFLNGQKIAESQPGTLTEGPIGFQAEDWEIEFRNVRIKEE